MYGLLLAILYLIFISLGLPDSLLGSGWPAMHPELDIPVSYMGFVSMTISCGTVVSSLLSDKLTKKIGTRIVTVVSIFFTAAALFGFSFSNRFWMLIIFAVPYGLGAGAIDAALNNYIAVHYKAKHMSWLHCFWGVGTIVSPFIMGYAVTKTTWHDGYRIVGFIQIAIAVFTLATLPLWKVNKKPEEIQQQKSVGLIGALKIKGVPFLLIGFFAYCAAEATTMYWASTYFVEVKNISVEQAANLASLFYIGLTVGRFISGFITEKLGDRKMIILGTCILTCGIVLLLPVNSYIFAVVAFIIIGLGCAPIYPCIIHSTPNNFGVENSGAIIGIQMASAYIGTTLIPPLFGVLGNAISFTIMPIYLLVFVALMITMTELTFHITKKNNLDQNLLQQ